MRMVIPFLSVLVLLFDTYWSCDPRTEFVASEKNFRNYQTWPAIYYTIGQSNPLLGGAHRGNDELYSRRMYMNPSAKIVNSFFGSRYSTGSIIIKETFTWINGEKHYSPMDGLVAMVKRGGN